ncbi:HIT family protein [Pigmentiphaga sp.]|uniref:HIT family protein n=1 Tax=Pigmentiphaga sp. TaxID=1977564 RepID=UPI00128C1C0B|nr:HIT family protein [Pigmentiphaga sp.]MPS27195.1 HIT family protein [Alcaligenaceae bacterium SAGV5]MPS51676.1 HIT family protein [Alcaligenaceae bacterium SAGV3]MPT59756.1 HIT family protein [Alcaligenaceae bacterium]
MSSSPDSCPLCAADGAPALWHNDRLRVIAVDDADYPGYVRVIWRTHVAEMTDLDDEDRLHMMRVVLEVEAVMRDHMQPDKVNLAALGNMVPHLHWHVIPRWRGDRHFPDALWAAPRVAPGAESDTFRERARAAAQRVPEFHRRLRERLSARFLPAL